MSTETQTPIKTSEEIRSEFLSFFEERGHEIVPSASLVPQKDPTLLFTNAGMNQFKDVFLGTGSRPYDRAVDTQKCLRVSGKHNDLEEVGHDTYHHTFFEMLGNWSFGDYFKKEAIRYAWELLTEVWGLDPDRLYATVHEGDDALGLDADEEAARHWKEETGIDPEHILFDSSKENFWMMGDTGPCGPCSEVHVDLRPERERQKTSGAELVNADHPQVMEIWNLVFIQYNAQPDGSLESLPAQHVDTGMGFERMVAVLQGKNSTYDTDLFAPLLQKTCDLSPRAGIKGYNEIELDDPQERERCRVALRVVADHIRAIAFAIADGVVPGNEGRAYVIRRIARRAVRYGYQTLGFREPFLYELVAPLREKMAGPFPELAEQEDYIRRVIRAEEEGFLETLGTGIKMFEVVSKEMRRAIEAMRQTADQVGPQLEEFRQNVAEAGKGLSEVERSMSETARRIREQLRPVSEVIEEFHRAKRVAQKKEEEEAKAGVDSEKIERLKSELRRDRTAIDRTAIDLLKKAYDESDEETVIEHFLGEAVEGKVPGEVAFLLHDTYGFPIDLTRLMAREEGLSVDMEDYDARMQEQKARARAASGFKADQSRTDTWQEVSRGEDSVFLGYDTTEVDEAEIRAVRSVEEDGQERHELVLDRTPFYAESGGQVGDTGTLYVGDEEIRVLDTQKEQERTVHYVDRLPEALDAPVRAVVDAERRERIKKHHTATHLLHAVLRERLGEHVQQKGSLVAPDRLRFDFSHFERVTPEELRAMEAEINEAIQRNIPKQEEREMPLEEALDRGAIALFGEKYGDHVRVITFDPDFSMELCGGTHVGATGEIGLFQFLSEGSVAAGVRRVEAVAGFDALSHVRQELEELERTRGQFKSLQRPVYEEVARLQEEIDQMEDRLEALRQEQLAGRLDAFISEAQEVDGLRVVTGRLDGVDMDALMTLGQTLRSRLGEGAVGVLGATGPESEKVYVVATVADDLISEKGLKAGDLVGDLGKRLGGGGGGRPSLAAAGGRDTDKLDDVLAAVPDIIREKVTA